MNVLKDLAIILLINLILCSLVSVVVCILWANQENVKE